MIYTCPMHPQIEQDKPGNCPICGMTLEPKNIVAGNDEENTELRDMTRRFRIGAALSVPVLILAMWHIVPSAPRWVEGDLSRWAQFILSTPVVLWCGWPFFQRGWQSIVNRSLNMFTLIAIGVGAAYFYSAAVMLLPQIFPPSFVAHGKIGKIDLVGGPIGLACGHCRGQRAPEDRELEAEAPPVVSRQVPGIVPPLGLELRVRCIVAREDEIADRHRPRKASYIATAQRLNYVGAVRGLRFAL